MRCIQRSTLEESLTSINNSTTFFSQTQITRSNLGAMRIFFATLLVILIRRPFIVAGSEEGPRTGSWQNCTNDPSMNLPDDSGEQHPHSAYIHVSCHKIQYRIPTSSVEKIDHGIIIGVLSGAAIQSRRTSIRSTWAYKKKNVFFIVAGPWENIEEEYNQFQDMIWIDKEEVYVTETSVLTFKTESFLSIFYKVLQTNDKIQYLLKTDDDSYVNVRELEKALLVSSADYWGKCHDEAWKPHRNQEIEWQKKWYISYETYAEPEYPPYCQGAGIGLSRKFMECAIDHIPKIRYMPNEDVAVGMLAERCKIPTTNDDRVWVRWDEEDGITMDGKIIQHYVNTETNMRLHHSSATGVNGPLLITE